MILTLELHLINGLTDHNERLKLLDRHHHFITKPTTSSVYCTSQRSQTISEQYNSLCLLPVAPTIEVDPRYRAPQEVKQGSTLVLPVNYSGVPRPRASWYHRGLPLGVRHGHVHIDSGDTYSTLTVLGIESNEGGKYEVAVENLAGLTKYEYDVIVKCK